MSFFTDFLGKISNTKRIVSADWVKITIGWGGGADPGVRIYAIILGVCSGSQVLKLVDNRHVKAACKLVVVGIAPFIAKMGITAGSNIDTILNAGPGFRHPGRSQYQLYRSLYHGRRLRRPGIGDQLPDLCEAGMENPDCGNLCDDRNFSGVLHLVADYTDGDRGDLKRGEYPQHL